MDSDPKLDFSASGQELLHKTPEEKQQVPE
jgi:hypothetical protein